MALMRFDPFRELDLLSVAGNGWQDAADHGNGCMAQRGRVRPDRSPGVDKDDVDLTIGLRGSVRSWSERHEAQKAAYAAPGVWTVHNYLTVRED